MNNPMVNHPMPLAGLLRVIYFLAVTTAVATLVLSGITSIYKAPAKDLTADFGGDLSGGFTGTVTGGIGGLVSSSSDHPNYQRNVGVILSLIGTAAMAASLLAFRAYLNPFRCGLLGGGLIVFLAAFSRASGGSNAWLASLMAIIALASLIYCAPYIEDGLPDRTIPIGKPPG